ncbi:MAG: hypothetical protein JWQ72_344 [Polaromonas sp.]|nr:hypothetical protein [Polaromonas sp.]
MSRSAIVPYGADPLGAYALPAVVAGTTRPVPLISTRFTVQIEGGLATVTAERVFRNAELASIEATFTFPVPIHATLFKLQARIGERVLVAQTQRRQTARETYEDALDRGKTTVLHEEVLRGVHQLSVGHVPPGQVVVVVSTWTVPLSAAPGGAMLHVPVSVGDIYGRSPLADSDDLLHSAALQEADLEVVCGSGVPGLIGGVLRNGRACVRLDAPIRILINGWQPHRLYGQAADGRWVTLDIEPAQTGLLPLDAAILVDRSGSMSNPVAGLAVQRSAGRGGHSRTKHQVLVAGMIEAAVLVSTDDRVDLWQFDNDAELVPGDSFLDAIGRLAAPRGGTEIGRAIDRVLAKHAPREILLITDGKSHAIDIQTAARSGRRFHVLLIGEDSLEANVGHLAALTGGQILIAAGLETGELVRQAVSAMRMAHAPAPPIDGRPTEVEAVLGGMLVRATWSDAQPSGADVPSQSVAAAAAALALSRMEENDAATLAEAEGIVCHLTSLVLVDEAGASQNGIPAQRKVAMTTPLTLSSLEFAACAPLREQTPSFLRLRLQSEVSETHAGPRRTMMRGSSGPLFSASPLDVSDASTILRQAAKSIDWSADPEALRRGDFSGLAASAADLLRIAAGRPEVVALAAELGIAPVIAAVGLLARAAGPSNRSAARLARTLVGKSLEAKLDAAAKAIGL